MDTVFLAGIGASIVTGIQFVPQLYRAYKTQKTRDISGKTLALIVLGNVLWLFYGVPKGDFPISLTSIMVLACVLPIVFIKYSHHKSPEKEIEIPTELR